MPTGAKSATSLGYQGTPEDHGNGDTIQYKSDTSTPNVYLKHADSVDEDEEADNHTMTRMLEDRSGRLLYLGDAANLSFLQLLRMIIETAAGPSPFTLDPGRHCITETTIDKSLDQHLTYRLPEKETALVLVDSFFVNTHGLIEIFDERAFTEAVNKCYADPLMMDRQWLCLFFLVLAIGLTLASPLPETLAASIVMKLRTQQPKLSEIFFLNAKSLNDPVNGMEDSDFWSVQALTLMAVYMLTHSVRNGAFAYVGTYAFLWAVASGLTYIQAWQFALPTPWGCIAKKRWFSSVLRTRRPGGRCGGLSSSLTAF